MPIITIERPAGYPSSRLSESNDAFNPRLAGEHRAWCSLAALLTKRVTGIDRRPGDA
ncbi:MAG: hypothetical protein ACOX87_03985 [Chloroflexota bacterium]